MEKVSSKTIVRSSHNLSKISAIFFDLDNTLIPTRKGDVKACKKLCEILQEQYGLSHEDANKCTSTFLRSFRSCPDNSQTTLDSWRSYLWSEALPTNLKHLNMQIYEKWLNLRYRYLSLTQEYEEVIKKLRNKYLLALITNGPSNAQWEKIHKLNLSNLFDCILVSSDLPWEKPNPNIFLTACNLLNVKSSQCIMIGDKIETDIKGAKDAKLAAAIWIPLNPQDMHRNRCDGQNGDSVNLGNDVQLTTTPDIIIGNLSELLKYLPIQSAATTSMNDASCCNNSRRRRLSYHQSTAVGSSSSSSSSSSSLLSSYVPAIKRHPVYKRVASLPSEFDGNSDNSLDSSYSYS